MEKFIQTLKTLTKILLHPQQKKKPSQKDLENLTEMLLQGCKDQGDASLIPPEVQKDMFEVLTIFMFYFKEKIMETFLDKILNLLLFLKIQNCSKKMQAILRDRLILVCKDCNQQNSNQPETKAKFQNFVNDGVSKAQKVYSLQNKVSCLTLLNRILNLYRRDKAEFESIVPGVCSFLAKAFNQEYETKQLYLTTLMDVFETFVSIFSNFYKDAIKVWNERSQIENDKKMILTSFSTDLNLYNKVKAQINIFGEEITEK